MNPYLKRFTALLFTLMFVSGCGSTAQNATIASSEAGDPIKKNISSEETTFDLYLVKNGLEHPWGMDWLPDGRIILTERPGKLKLLNQGNLTEVTGLPPIATINQGGLLDIKVHPNYEENGWIYFTYSSPQEGGSATTLSRARIEENKLVDFEELYVQSPAYPTGRHFGSRIEFLPDGTLVFTIGDRGRRTPAQDTLDPAGSNIRLNDDGSIPDDNPFVSVDGVLDEIYSYGHRNVQGMDLHPKTNQLWQIEHGPNGGDELNRIIPGENYGWPESTYGTEYTDNSPIGKTPDQTPQFEPPITYWGPTSIAPSGMVFYSGDKFPDWNGNIFLGALAKSHLRRIELESTSVIHQEKLLDNIIGRIRDVNVGPEDYLYLLEDAPDGGLYRLEPSED